MLSTIQNLKTYLKNNSSLSLLFTFCLFNIYLLSPILSEGFLYGGDSTSNFSYTVRISEMIADGNFRFWLGDYSMGQALFFYYQPIPHLLTALIYLALPFADPLFLYKLIVMILLVLLPLSMYQGMRWMGFSQMACLIGAILSCSISSWRGFGFELDTLFRWGQYAHTWGLVLTPIAIGYAYKNYFGERKLFIPVTLLGLLFLTHGVMGIIASLVVASLFLISSWTIPQKWKDVLFLSKLFIGVFCVAAIILVPNLLYEDYVDGFSTADKDKHFGIGLERAGNKFFAGEVFDQGSLPIITSCILLALLISGFCYLQNRTQVEKKNEQRLLLFLWINFLLSIVLISGAQTFPFLKHTPIYNNLLVLRLLPLWHFMAILLLSFSLGKLIEYAQSQSASTITEVRFLKYSTQVGIVLLIAYLGYRQQHLFHHKARTYNHIGSSSDKNKNYKEVLSFLNQQKHGRVHTAGIRSHFELHLPPLLADKPVSEFYAASSHTNLGLFYLKRMMDNEASHYKLFACPYLITKTNDKKDKDEIKGIGHSIYKNKPYEVFKTPASHHYFDITHANTVCFSHNQAARGLILNWMNTPELIHHKEHMIIAEDRPRSFFEKKGFKKFINLKQENKRVIAHQYSLENISTNEKIKTNIGIGFGQYLAQDIDSSQITSYGEILEEQVEDGYYKAKLLVLPNEKDSLLWATLKVNAHPDWIARVDGEIVDWVQMSPCFMAVALEPGTHIVEFEFTWSPVRKALLGLSFLTIIGLGLFEFLEYKWVKKRDVVPI